MAKTEINKTAKNMCPIIAVDRSFKLHGAQNMKNDKNYVPQFKSKRQI